MKLGAIEQCLRFFHTVRHLRAVQVVDRVTRRARPRVRAIDPLPRREALRAPRAYAHREDGWLDAERRTFLNETRFIGSAAVWSDPQAAKLWRYQLHCFHELRSPRAAERVDALTVLISRWVLENPPFKGDGWEPYPISLRAVNWIKWVHSGQKLPAAAEASLALQLEHLSRNLEYHLLGNHLLENARALIFGGLYFIGEAAERWLRIGRSIFEEQVREQVLEDGGHFERSPMYHALMLELALDVLNVSSAYGVRRDSRADAVVPRMLAWLAAMTHPDGDIALFNDAALGEAPSFEELAAYAGRVGFDASGWRGGVAELRESGYVRADVGEAALLMDVGSVGPDYLPAHAHADTLSVELSLKRRRVLVDTGTSVYAAGVRRALERSTAAHNTVAIEGGNSSDVWSSFRVGRRARVLHASVKAAEGEVEISGQHDGYEHLACRALHSRRVRLTSRRMLVGDRIDGRGGAQVRVSWHLHPDLRPRMTERGRCRIEDSAGAEVCTISCVEHELSIEAYEYAPRFGLRIPAWRIVCDTMRELPTELETIVSW